MKANIDPIGVLVAIGVVIVFILILCIAGAVIIVLAFRKTKEHSIENGAEEGESTSETEKVNDEDSFDSTDLPPDQSGMYSEIGEQMADEQAFGESWDEPAQDLKEADTSFCLDERVHQGPEAESSPAEFDQEEIAAEVEVEEESFDPTEEENDEDMFSLKDPDE